MEFRANADKKVEIVSGGVLYKRHAIQTHFVQIGEDYNELVERYVKPFYEEGDILSISEKIIGLCQRRVVYKKDMKISALAKFLSKFAMRTDAGIGVDSPYKMQFAIDYAGAGKVLWAAICSGIGKIFGKHGIFYDMVGQEVSGLDGFYDHEFAEYGNYGIRIPENSRGVCNEIYEKTGVQAMIVDANDLSRVILGHADVIKMTDEQLADLIRDNPAGQSTELTPFILIRPAGEPQTEEIPTEETHATPEVEDDAPQAAPEPPVDETASTDAEENA